MKLSDTSRRTGEGNNLITNLPKHLPTHRVRYTKPSNPPDADLKPPLACGRRRSSLSCRRADKEFLPERC